MDVLAGFVVVELATGVAGPYAGKLFADAGATVIKVEPPGGDPLRHRFPPGVTPDGDSALFQHLNTGKSSIVGSANDQHVEDFVARADLVIEDSVPSDPAVEAWRDRHPSLVVLSITPYGRRGPQSGRPAPNFILQAQSGSIGSRGLPDESPFQSGGNLAEWAAGVFGAVGALAAVVHARATGVGEHVDTSLLAADHMISNANVSVRDSLLGHPNTGGVPRIVDVPGVEPTRDGLIGFNTNTTQQLEAFLAMVGRSDLLQTEPRWVSAEFRLAHAQEFNDAVRPWLAARTTAEVMEAAGRARIPVAPVNSGETLLQQAHFVQRGVFGPMPDGAFVHPLPPYLLDGERPRITRPAPALGSGAELPPARPRSCGAPKRLPFEGLRVLDATAMWAGPVVGQLFAALGADVIHLESVKRLDLSRLKVDNASQVPRWWERGHTWFMVNFNKRDLTLDLGQQEGVDLLERLLPSCDVLVENYSPRVFEKFGLTADHVHEISPELVFARMPAFGLDGPWRDFIGFAQTMEQMSGLAWLTGPADGGAPVVPRGPCDPLAGYQSAFAIMLALIRRADGGGGCLVECAMAESAVNMAAESVVDHSAYGYLHERTGNRDRDAAPQGVYECDPEQWLAISVRTDEQWSGLVVAMGRPAWAARFATAAERHAGHDELDRRLAEWAAERSLDETVARLCSLGVPAAVVADPRLTCGDSQLRATGYLEPVKHAMLGVHHIPTLAFGFASVEHWVRTRAPQLGEHNEQILGRELGLTDQQLRALKALQVIGSEPAAGNPSFVM